MHVFIVGYIYLTLSHPTTHTSFLMNLNTQVLEVDILFIFVSVSSIDFFFEKLSVFVILFKLMQYDKTNVICKYEEEKSWIGHTVILKS